MSRTQLEKGINETEDFLDEKFKPDAELEAKGTRCCNLLISTVDAFNKFKRLRISLSKFNEILSETVGKKRKLTVKKRGTETDEAFQVRKTQAVKDHAQALKDKSTVTAFGFRT